MNSTTSFYRRVWRWHFYAGFFVIPFLIILSLSGMISLFQPQLDLLMYPKQVTVVPIERDDRPDTDFLLESAQRAYPHATPLSYASPPTADRSAMFRVLDRDGAQRSVFLNPYTGETLGSLLDTEALQPRVRKIHGELSMGRFGDTLIELAACWTLVLILSGLYLAWPETDRRVWGIWLPRLRLKGRAFWKDLHAVTGVYSSVFIILIILTGLPWTGFWGGTYLNLWKQYPPGTFAALTDTATQTTQRDSTTEQRGALPHVSPQSVSLQSIVELAQREGAPPGYTITLPRGPKGVYTVAAFTGSPTQELTLHINPSTGRIMQDVRYAQYGLAPRMVENALALHQGQLFGLANQLVCLAVCLLTLALCISGPMLWWKRRIPGTFGAPPRPELRPSRPKAAVITIGLFGIAFPFVGFSLIAIAILDFCITRSRAHWRRRSYSS